MAVYSKQAYACSPLREDFRATAEWPEGNPIPKKVGDSSPIKHVIYIIKENRTYDQVFGDVKEGNGDAHLCLFPEKIHAQSPQADPRICLARQLLLRRRSLRRWP